MTHIAGQCLWYDHFLTGLCLTEKLKGSAGWHMQPGVEHYTGVWWHDLLGLLTFNLQLTNATTSFVLCSTGYASVVNSCSLLEGRGGFQFHHNCRVALVHCSGVFSSCYHFFLCSLIKALCAVIGL